MSGWNGSPVEDGYNITLIVCELNLRRIALRLLCAASALLVFLPVVGFAEGETRELGSHEHGSGNLNIALEGNRVAMELEAPGADIVGFEYTATSDEDRATVDAAIADLARPLELFVFPQAAGCTVVSADVELLSDEHHEDHDEHDEHDHDDHEGEEHADHGHEHEEAEAQHSEFHVMYEFDCRSPENLETIDFAYFSRFPNALELNVQVVSDRGAESFEVERDAPVLDLR